MSVHRWGILKDNASPERMKEIRRWEKEKTARLGVVAAGTHPYKLIDGEWLTDPASYPAGDPAEINRKIAQGFRFFQASSDVGLMAGAAREMLSKVDRGAAPLACSGSRPF